MPARAPGAGRRFRGEVCPDHGIRCHHSTSGGTYIYKDVRRNIIASPETFARRIVGHPFKYESHRLGAERSEDALSWNVFRSLQEAGCLSNLARLITGDPTPVEPFLYLWGICSTDDDFTPWDLLVAARKRFESNLPVDRPMTEPDIALHLPGRYLILIEAKFTSANTYYGRGERKDHRSLTMAELVGLYQDPRLKMLDVRKADAANRLYQQLWRNMTFAEWMAGEDHPGPKRITSTWCDRDTTKPVPKSSVDWCKREFKDRFRQITWEWIYQTCTSDPTRNAATISGDEDGGP